ncbi:hypothetical protein [Photobacterium leiognathi]|uniref:hypothetical protein n=1 Tax=Photobacterium leiognathi TaxID=553611 RepID=UPI002981DF85|nr:hypothetical protein [Photobacterium leiognathi]
MKDLRTTEKALHNQLANVKTFNELVNVFDHFRAGGDIESMKEQLGRTSYVVTAKGQEVETGFTVIEASDLIISNTLDGRINPDYPQELQPRDRTRQSSIMQINKMANSIRPAQLADSGLSSHGAPIIGRDHVVESGNGRAMALSKAYIEGKADQYREYLVNNAAMYGLTGDKIKSMQSPVLVRIRLTDLDRAAFARDSNLSDLQSMSASETAYVDAERIDTRLMSMFQPSETGNLLSRSNDQFLQSFMREIGDGETAGLLTADGRYTKQLIDRVQSAIFAKAYKNEKLVRMMAEEPDPDIRNILTALNTAASSFVEMQYLSGEVHKQQSSFIADSIEELSQVPEQERSNLAAEALESLVAATELVRKAKDSGQDISELMSQQDMFGGPAGSAEVLASFIAANNRSSKRMGAAFKALAEEINKELAKSGSAVFDMFGGGEVTLVDILTRVSEQLEFDFNGGQTSMF